MRRLAVAGLALALACGGGHAPPFGKAIAPPPPLDQLQVGMTVIDAVHLVPALGGPQERTYVLELPATAWGRLSVITDGSPRRVTGVEALVHDRDLGKTLTAKWGPGQPDGHGTAWDSAASGWRAQLVCDRDDCNVLFRAHGAS
jgi:hypothetical protein